jgi:hypothetical protein
MLVLQMPGPLPDSELLLGVRAIYRKLQQHALTLRAKGGEERTGLIAPDRVFERVHSADGLAFAQFL